MTTVKHVLVTEFYGVTTSQFVDKETGEKGKPMFNFSFKFPNDEKGSELKIRALKKEVFAACKAKWGTNYKKVMMGENFKRGIRNGDEISLSDKMASRFNGSQFFKAQANANYRPKYAIKKGGKLLVLTKDEDIGEHFYPGCICHANLYINTYQNKGIGYSFSLNGLFKTKDGERASGETAEQMFDTEELLYEADDIEEITEELDKEFDEFDNEMDEFEDDDSEEDIDF